MPSGLGAELAAYARAQGAAAAEAIRAGNRPTPCRWDANGPSITAARLAAQWSAGFTEVMGPVHPLPEG